MKSLLITCFIVSLCSANFIKEISQKETFECDKIQYERPEIFYVRGTASQSIKPTVALINFGIEIKTILAEEAISKAAQITEIATKQIQSADTSNAFTKITTASFSLQPYTEQQYNKNTQNYEITFQGYRVTNNLIVETENLEIVGKYIDVAIKHGVTNIYSVSFDIKPEAKAQLRDLMMQTAIEDAQHKAQIILKPLNMKIHSIKSVQLEDSYAPRSPVMYKSMNAMEMDGSAGASTQIFASEQNINHSINIGFVIVPADN